MKNHKLFKVLSSIDHRGKKEFGAFLYGKFKGKNTVTWSLFQLMEKKGIEKWDISRIWKSLFKNQAFNQERMNKEVFKLYNSLLDYLPLFQLQKDPENFLLYKLKALNKPNLTSEFSFIWQKEFKKLKKNSLHSSEEQLFFYQAETELYNNMTFNAVAPGNTNLKEIGKTFNQYWMLEVLKLACFNLSHNQIHGEETDTELIKDIFPLIEKQDYITSIPVFKVYRRLYFLLKEREEHEPLISLLEKYKDKLGREDLINALYLGLNHYTYIVNNVRTTPSLLKESVDMYHWGYNQGLLHIKDGLNPRIYSNLLAYFLKLNRLDLANEYLEKWKPDLPKSCREVVYNNNLSNILFHQRKFSEAKKIINLQPKIISLLTFRSRILEIQIDYELDLVPYIPIYSRVKDMEAIINKTKSLIKFISDQRNVSLYHKNTYKDRLKLIIRLINAKTENGLLKIKSEITSGKFIDNPDWILEKVDERLKNEYGD